MTPSGESFSVLSSRLMSRYFLAFISLIVLAQDCCADGILAVRVTADRGEATEKVYTFYDGDPEDQNPISGDFDLYLTGGSPFPVFDLNSLQTFDLNLTVSSVSASAPYDFDLLMDVLSYEIRKIRVEITLTGLNPSSFVSPSGVFFGDIGGNIGAGMQIQFSAGIDSANAEFGLTQWLFDSEPTDSYVYSGLVVEDPFYVSESFNMGALSGPFSMTARYDITASAKMQSVGFDSYVSAVPEPSGMATLAGLSFLLMRHRWRRASPLGACLVV